MVSKIYDYSRKYIIDWSIYDNSISPWISGKPFDWDVIRLAKELDNRFGLVCQYIAAFYDGDDEAAIELHNRILVRSWVRKQPTL